MSIVKAASFILLGCVLGAVAIYIADKCVDSIFIRKWKQVGGLAPMFSVFEYLFTGLSGIFLGGVTLALVAHNQLRSFALLFVFLICSVSIIVCGMPLQRLFAHSQAVIPPFERGFDAAQNLLQAVYWLVPLIWSLVLAAYVAVALRRRAVPNINIA